MNQQALFVSDESFCRFLDFHHENPMVYRIFQEMAFEMLATGRKHYSARAIMEVARWRIDLQTTGEPFKLNNNHTPWYSKMFMEAHPEHEGFFRTRG